MPRGVRGVNGSSWGDLNYGVIWRASYDRAGMADAVAHGVTKTTPNATHRRGSACIVAGLDCLMTGLSRLLRPLLLRWALPCEL